MSTMSSQNKNKLNQLLKDIPEGAVIPTIWLNQKGIYRQLADRYVRSGWLERFANGAYVRSGCRPGWTGGLYALQNRLNMPVHIGAYTALNIKGLGHFLPLGNGGAVYLFSNEYRRLPAWFTGYDWSVNIKYYAPKLFSTELSDSNVTVEAESLPVIVSAPEKAMLEALYLAHDNEDIDFCIQLMEGLSTLRPALLQSLLESCSSIKVKRLFLWMAETARHSWFNHLRKEAIDLGKGKRHLYKGGVFNTEYQITIPGKEETPSV